MKLRFYSRSQCKEIPLKAWESLAERAIVSNPFYEHWNLIPALEHLEQSSKVELVTAWRGHQLVGLFPICYSTRLPIFTVASVWKHDECYCTSPLVLDNKVWEQLLPLLWKTRRVNMLINTTQTHNALTSNETQHLTSRSYYRAALDSSKSYDSMTTSWPRKRRKEWQRLLRKSMENDQANYHTANTQQACRDSFELYTQIESKGWKGRAGSAIAQDQNKLSYYRDMIAQGCEVGQVETQLLTLKDEPIAASIRITRGKNAFEVKTSYCEGHRSLAPGVLLEILNMKQLASSKFQLADSCTQPGNRLMEALWHERVAVYNSVYFGPGLLSKMAWLATKIHKKLKHARKSLPEPSEHNENTASLSAS